MAELETESAAGLPRALSKISAFPPVAIRVLHLLSDEDVDIRELLGLLTADPAFSAQILSIANSPLYGFKSQIDSVQHALVVLGLERTKAITLTVATGFFLRGLSKIDLMRRCWRYSLACALLAEELARACNVHEDRAYTAALLHDVGRLGLVIAYADQYSELIREANEALGRGEPFDLREQERLRFGIDRCEAGRLLAAQWNFPREFRTIAGYHLDFPTAETFDLLALVRLSCQFANALGFDIIKSPAGPSFEDLIARIPEQGRRLFPSDPTRLTEALNAKIDSYDMASMGGPLPGAGAEPAPAPSPEENPAPPVEPAQAASVPQESAAAQTAHRVTGSDIAVFLAGTVFFGLLFLLVLSYFFSRA